MTAAKQPEQIEAEPLPPLPIAPPPATPPTPAEIIADAELLLADPRRWVQGQSAVDANGAYVSALDYRAVRCCMDGALRRAGMASFENYNLAAKAVEQALLAQTGELISFSWWQDRRYREHSEVIALLVAARQNLLAQGDVGADGPHTPMGAVGPSSLI